MTQASYKSFLNQVESGKKETDATRIYKYIKKLNASMIKPNIVFICDGLKMKHQTATARLSDLMDIGVVETEQSNQEETLSFFKVQEDDFKIAQNSKNRSLEKFKSWVAKGKKFNLSKNEMIDYLVKNY